MSRYFIFAAVEVDSIVKLELKQVVAGFMSVPCVTSRLSTYRNNLQVEKSRNGTVLAQTPET